MIVATRLVRHMWLMLTGSSYLHSASMGKSSGRRMLSSLYVRLSSEQTAMWYHDKADMDVTNTWSCMGSFILSHSLQCLTRCWSIADLKLVRRLRVNMKNVIVVIFKFKSVAFNVNMNFKLFVVDWFLRVHSYRIFRAHSVVVNMSEDAHVYVFDKTIYPAAVRLRHLNITGWSRDERGIFFDDFPKLYICLGYIVLDGIFVQLGVKRFCGTAEIVDCSVPVVRHEPFWEIVGVGVDGCNLYSELSIIRCVLPDDFCFPDFEGGGLVLGYDVDVKS